MKAPFELKTEHEPKDRLAVDSQKNNASSDTWVGASLMFFITLFYF